MFVLVFLALILSNYIVVADLPETYKIGYFIGLVLLIGIIVLSIVL